MLAQSADGRAAHVGRRGSPVLVYNLLVLAGFALSGFAMAWVVSRWTGSRAAGIVAGLAYAFNAHTLARFGHLQALHVEFLPVALYALDLAIDTAAPPARALLLALALVLQALTSNYLLVMTAIAMIAAVVGPARTLAPAAASRAPHRRRASPRRRSWRRSCTLNWLAHTRQGLVRSFDDVAMYSGDVARLALHRRAAALRRGGAGAGSPRHRRRSFPGITVTLLALAAVVRGGGTGGIRAPAWRWPSASPGAALVVRGEPARLSRAATTYIPLLQGIRAVSRFGWLTLFALPILAGFTMAAWTRRARRRSPPRR